jgi:hypothetical protein
VSRREATERDGRAVKRTGIATGKVGPRRAIIGHEQRVSDKGGVADHVRHTVRRVSRCVHIHNGVSEEEFVRMRTARDAQLGMPKLILPSAQVNMRAGEFPPAEDDGQTYLKIPLNQL